MTALQLNAELYRNLGVIAEDETMLDKIVKYARKLVKQMSADPTCMSKAEFFARVDEAKKGKTARMLPNEDLTAFLRRQGYDL